VDNYTFHHHIQQTFLGPICTACGHKVANGNILFDISRNSIKNHRTTNKCFSGDLALFKPKELEKALRTAMIHLHNSMRDNLSLASRMVENKYNFVQSVKNFPYCAQCGFVGTKLCHVRRHAKSQSTVCSESDVRPADGTIRTNEYGFLIPSVVLDKIGRGLFVLPTKRCIQSNVPTQFNTPIILPSPHAMTETNSCNRNTPATTSQGYPLQFLPTDEDITKAVSNNSPYKDAVSLNSFALAELLDTFNTKEMADSAYEYLTSYILLIDQTYPGLLKKTLTEYTIMMKPNLVNSTLNILLLSGKLWLQSNAANMDVRMVPVHHRNGIYLIGNTYTDNDKDLLKGNTFVWSDNVDTIIDQYSALISFAHETKWPKMTQFLQKVQHVYLIALEDPTNDGEDQYSLASTKLVNTNIIFGLLTEMLLEQPSLPNGPNLIYRYLAGSTIRRSHSGTIIIRNHNEISKNANALLRLLRHGVCSNYIRQSQLMTQRNESHKTFEVWANSLIQQMQVCPAVGHICRSIRTAREVDRKTPSHVQKAFNDKTGELLVAGCQIHKSTWSTAIPTAISEWDKHLTSLFPAHSPSSNLPLHWLFDLDNDIIIADDDSYVSIDGDLDQSIPLSEFKPLIPE
jgi:hypothetical protein